LRRGLGQGPRGGCYHAVPDAHGWRWGGDDDDEYINSDWIGSMDGPLFVCCELL
jgi:hypothetical protein